MLNMFIECVGVYVTLWDFALVFVQIWINGYYSYVDTWWIQEDITTFVHPNHYLVNTILISYWQHDSFTWIRKFLDDIKIQMI